jgi:hypothetical protein
MKRALATLALLAACAGSQTQPPPSGTLDPIGTMTQARAAHSATVLENGLVLIAGRGSLALRAVNEVGKPCREDG